MLITFTQDHFKRIVEAVEVDANASAGQQKIPGLQELEEERGLWEVSLLYYEPPYQVSLVYPCDSRHRTVPYRATPNATRSAMSNLARPVLSEDRSKRH
eukprot:g32297.t1